MVPKWYRNGTEMVPKWSQNGPKVTPKGVQKFPVLTEKNIFSIFYRFFFSLLGTPLPPTPGSDWEEEGEGGGVPLCVTVWRRRVAAVCDSVATAYIGGIGEIRIVPRQLSLGDVDAACKVTLK